MNKINEFFKLFEGMTIEDAKSILGINLQNSDLKKAYRQAALKAHPDRGGSDEEMLKVNQAYELLKNTGFNPMSREERDAQREREEAEREEQRKRDVARVTEIANNIKAQFDVALGRYKKHFEPFFKLEDPEVKVKVFDGKWENPQANIFINWPSEDGKTDIRLVVNISPDQGKGLADNTSEPVYNVYYKTSLYHNRKDHKMAQRDWDHYTTSSVGVSTL